jgi:hypothetical protein
MNVLLSDLLNLNSEQISCFNHEKATKTLEMFNEFSKKMNTIWNLFKMLDSDKSDHRTFELLNNHANGSVIKKMAEFKASCRALFSVPESDEDQNLKVFQKMAESYLEYIKHKTQLDNNQSLVENRAQELDHEENTVVYNNGCK